MKWTTSSSIKESHTMKTHQTAACLGVTPICTKLAPGYKSPIFVKGDGFFKDKFWMCVCVNLEMWEFRLLRHMIYIHKYVWYTCTSICVYIICHIFIFYKWTSPVLTFKHAKRVGETCEGCDAFATISLMAFFPTVFLWREWWCMIICKWRA